MTPDRNEKPASRWLSIAAFTVVCLLLAADAAMKLLQLAPVLAANAELGFDGGGTFAIGAILAVCIALYVLPVTRFAGALLLTAYLGGAVAIHLRAHSGLFQMLFPVFVGGLVWGALLLAEPRTRRLPWFGRIG